MFNQPILNEMMSRSTLEYRARDLEAARRAHLVRTSRRRPARARRPSTFARIRHAVRSAA